MQDKEVSNAPLKTVRLNLGAKARIVPIPSKRRETMSALHGCQKYGTPFLASSRGNAKKLAPSIVGASFPC
jgi:hypothetical protein